MKFELLPSDEGDHPLSPFPLHNEVITSAVEIEKDKIMVSIEGRNKLFVIDVATRMAIKAIVNPTTIC